MSLLLLLLPVLAVFAQKEAYRFSHLSIKDGLSDNSVFCMVQDSYGFMWLGTFSGLDRFDGNQSTVFKPNPGDPTSITGSVVFGLLEDRNNNLWVGLDGGGLNRFDRKTQGFTAFHHNAADPDSLASEQVFALAQDSQGRIWVGTGDSGLDRLDPATGKFTHFRKHAGNPTALQSDTIRCILEDRNGKLWVGTAGGGISRYDPAAETFFTYRHRTGDLRSIASDTVRALFQDSKGRLWIGTEGGGLSRYSPSTDSFVTYRHDPRVDTSFGGQTVRSVAEDSAGRIWVGSEASGADVFDPETELFTHIQSEENGLNGLSGNKIRSIFIDDGGLVWVGTRDAGISVYNPRSRAIAHIGSRYPVRQISEDSAGRLMYGTDGGGLVIRDPRTGLDTTFTHSDDNPESLSSNVVYTMVDAGDGHLWVGTDGGGLNDLDTRTGRSVHYRNRPDDDSSLGSNVVWALYRDVDGTLWVGTEGGGLNRFDRRTGTFTRYHFDPKDPHSLNGNSVRTIYKDSKGRLWIGTWDGGLSLYRQQSDDFVQFRRDPHNPSSLGDNSVNCIFEDRTGNLWIGTAGSGLNRYFASTGRFTHLTHSEGLAADNVFGILQDNDGYLWISTGNGLSRVDPRSQAIANFSVADGLAADEFSQNAYYRSSAGVMYFGGPRGIDEFNPASVRRNPNVPPVVITAIRILGQRLVTGRDSSGRLVFAGPKRSGPTLQLDYNDRMASFDFAVLDYAAPPMNQYAMKIDGLQTDWTFLGNQHTAVISSLRPGNYVLRVRGANNNGLWNETGTSLKIVVSPPWWRTVWFEVTAALLALTLAASFYAGRTLQLRRRAAQLQAFSNHIQRAREEERKNAARDVHDELGQHLAALKLQLCWIESHPETAAEAMRGSVGGLIEIVDTSLDSVKSISNKLRPKVLDNLTLAEAIRWLTSDFERRTGIRCIEEIADVSSEPPEELRTGLFRVFQETLTNISRHSGARTVSVTLRSGPTELVLEVTDDGVGISEQQISARDSFGILGMRERCALFSGSFSIGAATGGGTRVTVSLPLGFGGQKNA